MSRISAPSLPLPETSPMRESKTSSIASCKAGNGGCLTRRSFQPSRTSDHKTQASKKLGATGLPSPTRRSVSCKAVLTNSSSERATTTSKSGYMPFCKPSTFNCATLASAWPVCKSLSISSNKRLCGTSAKSLSMRFKGAAVLASSENPRSLSLATKRTARMMRTGSSR